MGTTYVCQRCHNKFTNCKLVDGADYGFKAYSLVVKGVNGHDVRIDLTTPKAKEATYDYVLEALADEDAE